MDINTKIGSLDVVGLTLTCEVESDQELANVRKWIDAFTDDDNRYLNDPRDAHITPDGKLEVEFNLSMLDDISVDNLERMVREITEG